MFGREVKAKVENKNQNVYNLQRNIKVLAAYDGCGGTKQGGDTAGKWETLQRVRVRDTAGVWIRWYSAGHQWTHYVTQVTPIIFIGPRSDHSLPMSVTDWLTDWLSHDLVEDIMNWPKCEDFADYADYVE